MFHKNTIEMQPTNNTHILKKNLKKISPFKGWLLEMDWAGGVIFIGWFVALVVLVPGALIKTAVDINTRKKLTRAELEDTITDVNSLDENGLDQLVTGMSHYPASSDSSKNLISELLNTTEKNQKDTFEQNKIDELKKNAIEKHQEDLKQVNKTTKERTPGLKLLVHKEAYDYEFEPTFDDKTYIENEWEQNIESHRAERIKENKNKIISFLQESYNAGKKLQHIIKDTATSIANLKI